MTATGQERTPSGNRCPVCGGGPVRGFAQVPDVPVHCHLLMRTREAARAAPRGRIELGFCRDCGHVFNLAFDPARMRYDEDYENALDFSPHFQGYAASLAQRLVDRYDLHGKTVVELGCGDGAFLHRICRLGDNRGVGFDPGRRPDAAAMDGPPDAAAAEGAPVTILGETYSTKHAGLRPDLVCCRHVLEHVADPRAFLADVRAVLGGRSGTALYFEVPNGAFTWRDNGIWDLIYEHFSYFSARSLDALFRASGFDVVDIHEAYDGQFLGIEARPGDGPGETPAAHGPAPDATIKAFARAYREKCDTWRKTLDGLAERGERAVVWGAGSKAVSFLNTFFPPDDGSPQPLPCPVAHVVDINPRKHGFYTTGSGHRIVAPEHLRQAPPDAIIVMNPVYRAEIEETVRDLLPDDRARTVTWLDA